MSFFFTSAQSPSEGSTVGSASARTADEVRAGGKSTGAKADGCPLTTTGLSEGRPVGSVASIGTPARTFYDIFFDSIKATVEAFDGR